MIKYLRSLAGKYITSSASGYLSIALVALILSTGFGAFYGVKSGLFSICDQRCEGLVSEDKVTELEKENAALRASAAKTNKIRNEVHNATNGIVSGNLPAYTSSVLDCLRAYGSDGNCDKMQYPSTSK